MMISYVNCFNLEKEGRMINRKGQLKIQQMAFVLIAIMIFFALVAIFYFSIRLANLQESAGDLGEREAREVVRKLATSPEFGLLSKKDCDNCIDLDKLIVLKDRVAYQGFWNLDYLAVERIYPNGTGECTLGSYRDCSRTTIIEKTEDFGAVSETFVSLCYWGQGGGSGFVKCEIGRIYASGKGINE